MLAHRHCLKQYFGIKEIILCCLIYFPLPVVTGLTSSQQLLVFSLICHSEGKMKNFQNTTPATLQRITQPCTVSIIQSSDYNKRIYRGLNHKSVNACLALDRVRTGRLRYACTVEADSLAGTSSADSLGAARGMMSFLDHQLHLSHPRLNTTLKCCLQTSYYLRLTNIGQKNKACN